MAQKPLFTLHAAGIAGHRTVTPDDPMARHHNTHRVGAIGGPHRACRAGTTERFGQLTVVHHLAAGDIAQRLPDLALERGAGGGGRQGLDNGQVAGKIVVQLTAETARIAAVDALIAFPAIVYVEQGFHPIAVLVPLDGA